MIINNIKNSRYKVQTILFSLLFLPFLMLSSCSSEDDSPITPEPDQTSKQVIIDKSGETYVNTGKIVIGLSDDDITYKRETTIIDQRGKVKEIVRDCSAMAAIKLNGDEQDTLNKVNNVTLINKGTIEIHTKNFVEKFRDQTQFTRDNSTHDRPYHYLRVIGMLAEGENDMLINEGLIDVYFDHDPMVDFKVYCFAICGNDYSTFINRGQIRFQGLGGEQTRMRGMGTMGKHVTSINDGTMTCNVDIAEDTRFITTGGDFNDIVNNGAMVGKTTGRLIGMTRFGDSNIVNNGTIDLTTTKVQDGYNILLYPADRFTCGIMESVSSNRYNIPPMNNRGTINVAIEASETPAAAGYGIFYDMVSPNNTYTILNNEGSINVRQSDSQYSHDMAEVGFVDRSGQNGACHVQVGHWNTTLRDFGTTHDLFFAKGICMDFAGAKFQLKRSEGYIDGTAYSVAPESLIYNADPENTTFEYNGYDQVNFSPSESNVSINWDKENMTVSLSKK